MTEKRITKELYDTLEYLQENNQINDANLIDFIVQSEIDHKNTEAIQALIRATKTYKADKRYTRDLTKALTTLRRTTNHNRIPKRKEFYRWHYSNNNKKMS